jgi:hypothetical protein
MKEQSTNSYQDQQTPSLCEPPVKGGSLEFRREQNRAVTVHSKGGKLCTSKKRRFILIVWNIFIFESGSLVDFSTITCLVNQKRKANIGSVFAVSYPCFPRCSCAMPM